MHRRPHSPGPTPRTTPAPFSRAGARLVALVLVAVAGSGSVAWSQGAPRRVLLVDLDDVGHDLLEATETPTLDRLAQVGRTYTRFYTSPVCSPTRAQMNLGALLSDPDLLCGGIVTENAPYDLPLGPLVPLARAVSDAGLSTAKVGKWHLCQRTRLEHPNHSGWQSYQGVMANLSNLPLGIQQTYFAFLEVHDGVASWVQNTYLTTRETDQTIAHLEAHVDLVSLSYHAVHKPFHVPPPNLHSGPFPATQWDKARAALRGLDQELGRLLAAALEHGYTVLLFSDNGTSQEIGGLKGTVREGGVRTFLHALGPGVVPGEDGSLVGVEDVYATVLDLLAVPRGPLHGPHSTPFTATLAGQPGARTWVVSQKFPPAGTDPNLDPTNWHRMALRGRYKLVLVPEQVEPALYDLTVDPEEQVDLVPVGLTGPEQAAYTFLRGILDRL